MKKKSEEKPVIAKTNKAKAIVPEIRTLELKESELSKIPLKYEKIKDKNKKSVLAIVKAFLLKVKANIKKDIKKAFQQSKKTKKGNKISDEIRKNNRNRGIIGICQLFVVVSIIYSTAIILMGVDSQASKAVLLPQFVFALIITFKAFSKLYK